MDRLKTLNQFINENLETYKDEKLKLSDEELGKLIDLDIQYDKIMEKYHIEKSHFQNVSNMSELVDRFMKHIEDDDDWSLTFDKIKYEESSYVDDKWYNEYHKSVDDLIDKFYDFKDCYLSKFYIEKLNLVKRNIEYIHEYVKGNKFLPEHYYRPTDELYYIALEYIKKNPVQTHDMIEKWNDKDYDKVIEPEDAAREMQKEIDKQGYNWKVELDPNLVPRMSVKTYKKFLISDRAKFSKIDLDSLRRHEINTHVARKYNGLKRGLYLFLYGLHGAGTYDEGMAIYNSLDLSPKPKPNILFYISKKIVLLKHLFSMNNDELFKLMKKLTGARDREIVIAIIRGMRVVFWNSDFASSLDASYLTGYELIRKMDDEARKELLEYNIGPDQLFELNTIKKFLKINKFKPLI